MKKILTVMLAAFLLLTGCAGKLTAEEYRELLLESSKAYSSQQWEICVKLLEGDGADFQTMKACVDDARTALEKLSQLDPPVEYSGQHKAICDAMAPEKLWLDTIEKIADNGEFTQELEQEVVQHAEDSEFYEFILATLKRMRDDGVSDELV